MELGSSSIEHMMYCKAKPYYLLQRKQGRMQYNKILCRKLDTLNLLFEHLKWSANKQREQSDGPPIRTGTLKMSKGHPRAMPKGSSDHSRFFGGLSSCSTPRSPIRCTAPVQVDGHPVASWDRLQCTPVTGCMDSRSSTPRVVSFL